MACKSLFVGALLVAAAATPASAHCYYGGYGCNGGAAFVGGVIAGGILGALSAPPPQPYIVVVPTQPIYAAPQPQPTYTDPEPAFGSPSSLSRTFSPSSSPQTRWYCPTSSQWYPDTTSCSVAWASAGDVLPISPSARYVSPPVDQRYWYCRTSARWYPDAQTCPVPWSH